MGNCVSFQLSCDQTVNHIARFLYGKGYIRNLQKNLEALHDEMQDLIATQHDVQNKVAIEEKQNRRRLDIVQVWLTRVEKTDIKINNLRSTSSIQLQKLCLCGLCSKNVCSSYNYGKSVFLMLKEVKKLKLEGQFEVVTGLTPRPEQYERPTQPTIGHEIMLEKAWKRIKKDGLGIMGLHGMGGVGKTTLFKKIHNKLTKMADRFEVVIWVVVSQGAEISKIQEDIAQKLYLCDDMWKNKNESDKAAEMHRALKEKRFVLMLDDLWEKVDLEAIGVPFPTIENGCKVAFTTRSREVCGRMGDHEPMQVNCLERHEAWELFSDKIGENTLRRNLVIKDLAKKVVEKCGGLPLALSVIGETMASKTTVQEWEHALDLLTRSAAEFPDMENKILPILKFSYDSLVDENIKSCFLYCALFPEDYVIDMEKLIEYWICEGFLGECQNIRRAKNKGYQVLGSLIRANLLTKPSYICKVTMHDVVREMALWIASDFGKQKENFVVQARLGLLEQPKIKDLEVVRRLSLMDNQIEEITYNSKCLELTTLFLQNNYKLVNLSGKFIQSMKKLVVLDLSGNGNFSKLPEQISQMACLRYLNLSFTNIVELPIGFQQLKMLTQLDLSCTSRLCSISGISKLSSLRILKLVFSRCHGDVNLVKELQLLENLQVLTITITTELSLELISCDQRLVNCIDCLQITYIREKPVNISSLVRMENLRDLRILGCDILETSTYMKCRETEADTSHSHSPITIPCFTNLSDVEIGCCNSIKDLTWLLFAPNLVELSIYELEEVEEIIEKEKATNHTGITPFQKLDTLYLSSLPKLESIYGSPLPFPYLKKIHVERCPKLRKLPLNATSVPLVEKLYIEMDDGQEIEWEDVDTKNRFLPKFNRIRTDWDL